MHNDVTSAQGHDLMQQFSTCLTLKITILLKSEGLEYALESDSLKYIVGVRKSSAAGELCWRDNLII